MLEFKLIDKIQYDSFNDDIDAIRRNSLKVKGQSTRYTVDISSYEYISPAKPVEIDGTILKVYTPEMILVEKIRALCQSMPKYKDIVTSARCKQRARDIYDIWIITESFSELNLTKELFQNIFDAKQVPLEFMRDIESLREHNRANWETVMQTVSEGENLENYDFYFNHVIELIRPFL